ncbi:MAG: hypothetical protein AAGA00_06050 [Pseudomonadota bacterium]
MDPLFGLALLPLSVAVLVGGMAIIRAAGSRLGWSAELQRKSVHVATGLFAMSLPWILPEAWLVYTLLAVAVVVMLVLRLPAIANGIGSALHGVERKSWGDLMLVAAVASLYFISGQAAEPVLYLLPLAVLTLSDTAAALAGVKYGQIRFTVEDGQKSLEGSAIFFLVTWIIAMAALLLLSDVPRANVVLLSFMTAAFATLVEADSWRGFDNYFVPVGVMLLISVHMDSSPRELVMLAMGFLATLYILTTFGGRLLGLTDHAARAYTAGIFMISTVTAPQNLVLPVVLLITHAVARRLNPDSARYPDLDMLAALAAISFISLIGGLAAGRTAISFYAIACAGLILQMAVLAACHCSRAFRFGIWVGAGAILFAATISVVALNGLAANWHGEVAWITAASLLLCGAVAFAWPGFLIDRRHAKTAIIALIIPLTSYLVLHFGKGVA